MNVFDVVIRVIFPVLTIVVSGACVLLFGGYSTVKSMYDDQGKRINFLENERDREREDRTREREKELEVRAEETEKFTRDMSSIRAEADVLRRTVTGEVHLVAITDLLTHHHDEARSIWEKFAEAFAQQEQRLIVLTAAVESVDSNMDTVCHHLQELIDTMKADNKQ